MNIKKFENDKLNVERIIYSASPFAKENLFFLQEIGNSKYFQPYLSTRTYLESFLFIIVNNGHGSLNFHNTQYNLRPCDCIFLNCREPYTISSSEKNWDISWIHFDGTTMNGIYNKFFERCGTPCFSLHDTAEIKEIHSHIMEIASNNDYVRDMLLMSQLSNLLSIIMKCCWSSSNNTVSKVLDGEWSSIKHYLDTYYTEDLSLDYISEAFHINKFYISRKFKELYGTTINNYIQDKRISYAKQYLRYSDLSIADIASKCGYADFTYFTRVFKKKEGMSPSKFKKEWKTEYTHR